MAAIWDTATGKQLYSLVGHTRPIFGVAFTPDGSRLATASGDGTVKIWDSESGKELLTLLGHTGRVFGVAISSDGTQLATAGQDGTSRVYLLKIEDLVKLAQSRLTRSLTAEECQKYLHVEACPTGP
jgi:WD40 repeat protein